MSASFRADSGGNGADLSDVVRSHGSADFSL